MRAFLAAVGAAVSLMGVTAAGASAYGTPNPARALRRALTHGLRQAGGTDGVYVVDLTTGQPLFEAAPDVGRIPASVEKLYTTSTVLLRFGPAATLTTSIFGSGFRGARGTWFGTLYLRGGGDPTFGSASFDQSAYGTGATIQQLVANLISATGITAVRGKIVGDASYFDFLPGTSESNFQFDPYMEGALSGLAFNRGLINGGSAYITRPGLFAARQFAATLRADRVRIGRRTHAFGGRTPASAKLLATVSSPTIATLISLTNTPSDNFFAEMLLKDLGARFGGAGTTAAGAAVVRAEIASQFGIDPTLVDGSGLSYADSTTPRQVVTLLTKMAGDTDFVNSLAIGGETGTLQYEMQGTPAQGNCRGKTGTLSDVANLAGYCKARDGHTLAFAFLMNSVSDPSYAHAVEANMAVALARYNG